MKANKPAGDHDGGDIPMRRRKTGNSSPRKNNSSQNGATSVPNPAIIQAPSGLEILVNRHLLGIGSFTESAWIRMARIMPPKRNFSQRLENASEPPPGSDCDDAA